MLNPSNLSFSTASLAGHSIPAAARVGWDMGFRSIELLAFDGYRHSQGDLAGFYFDRMNATEREALREVVAPFDSVSTHAPFIDMPLLAPNPGLKAAAVAQLETAITATAFLGGSTTTAHVPGKSGYTLEEAWPEILATFRALGDCAGEAGVTLTIETGYPVGVDLFAQLIHDIDHPAVGANIDVGHLVGYIAPDLRGTEEGAAVCRETLTAQLDALGEKVYHFHLHDLRLADFRDHRACGRGYLDYVAIMRWCRDASFTGVWAFELEEPDIVPALAESKAVIERAIAAVL